MYSLNFIRTLENDSLFAEIIKDTYKFNFNSHPSLFVEDFFKVNYQLGKFSIGNYTFLGGNIHLGRVADGYIGPELSIKLKTDDTSIFDDTISHFGRESISFEIPDQEINNLDRIKVWQNRLGIFDILEKEVHVKMSKFSTGFCIITLMIYKEAPSIKTLDNLSK